MSNNNNKSTFHINNKYTGNDRDNYDKWRTEMEAVLSLHPNKLDTVVLQNFIDPTLKKRLKSELKAIDEPYDEHAADASAKAAARQNFQEYFDGF
jgi:hypothetical protein